MRRTRWPLPVLLAVAVLLGPRSELFARSWNKFGRTKQEKHAPNTAVPLSLLPAPTRHFVVVCHRGRFNGDFQLDDLAQGNMDLKARCIQAALLFSHGVRKDAALTLLHSASDRALTVHGDSARLLFNSERGIADIMRRSLCRVPMPGEPELPPAEEADDEAAILGKAGRRQKRRESRAQRRERQRGDAADAFLRLREQCRRPEMEDKCGESCGLYVQDSVTLTEAATGLTPGGWSQDDVLLLFLAEDGDEWKDTVTEARLRGKKQVVLLLGDNDDLVEEELEQVEKLRCQKVRLGSVPLLASHCIVIAHHMMDFHLPPADVSVSEESVLQAA